MMAYEITAEDARVLREAMKNKENSRHYRRLLAVALRGEGKNNEEAAAITKYHYKRVSQLVSKYCNEGIEALLTDGRKGGNHRNMSEEEASEFLAQFDEKANEGQIVTVEEIAAEFDRVTGKTRKSLSTVYNFLHIHNWRAVTPRGQNSKKANNEVIAVSKKKKNDTE